MTPFHPTSLLFFQLSYLGPPFNDKDFSPPRPNSTALSLPSAATRLELWHGLENQARLAQNQKAYSVLLAAVRELARSTLCPSLKMSLLHFCTGLDGLLGSISALMTSLGYNLPPSTAIELRRNPGAVQYPQIGAGGNRPAPLMSQSFHRYQSGTRTQPGQRNSQRKSETRARGEGNEGTDMVNRRRGGKERRKSEGVGGRGGVARERGRGERRSRGRRAEPEGHRWRPSSVGASRREEEEDVRRGEGWGSRRRRLLSISHEGEELELLVPLVRLSYPSMDVINNNDNNNNNNNQYSYDLNRRHSDTIRSEDGFVAGDASSRSTAPHRPPRSLLSSPATLQPPLSSLSLLYPLGASEEHTLLSQPVPLSLQRGTAILPPPLTPLLSSSFSSPSSLIVRPTMNDFARKVEGFWILRELQSWLWRSAKDFNRLKKRLRG